MQDGGVGRGVEPSEEPGDVAQVEPLLGGVADPVPVVEHDTEGARGRHRVAVHRTGGGRLHPGDPLPPEVAHGRGELGRFVEEGQRAVGLHLLQHQAHRVARHRLGRRVGCRVRDRKALQRRPDAALGGTPDGLADRHVVERPDEPDPVALGTGTLRLGGVVPQRTIDVALVQRHVGQDVTGMGDTGGSRGRYAARGPASQLPGEREVATVPCPPCGGTDRGDIARVLGIRLDQYPLGPARGLVPDAQVDEFGYGGDQPDGEVGVPVGTGRDEGGTHVVVVGQRVVHPGPLVRTLQTVRRPFGQLDVVGGVPVGQRTVGARGLDAVSAVRPQRLQKPVPAVHRAHGDHQRPVDEPHQPVQDVVLGRARVGDTVHPPQVGTTREDRQGGEQPLFGLRQQPVGPVDRRSEALVPRDRAPATTEQRSPFQPTRDLDRAHRPHPRRCELDTQRQSVEASADRRDGVGVGTVEPEVG